jgi:hypothetical protein
MTAFDPKALPRVLELYLEISHYPVDQRSTEL